MFQTFQEKLYLHPRLFHLNKPKSVISVIMITSYAADSVGRKYGCRKSAARSNAGSKQIGVSACALKCQKINPVFDRINQKPVGGDMTLPTTFIITF